MQRVLVVDKHKKALMPCQPVRARELLQSGKAAVHRRFPFTIILKERAAGDKQPIALKIDPGSKTTGLALVADFQSGKRVIWGAELTHRGQQIRGALLSRSQHRRSCRARHTRYRPARFLNRVKPKGWLAPSLKSRMDNIWTWSVRLAWRCPITSLSQELARFDMQLMQNAEISGVEYQQGALQGYEVREYLLEKWGRTCAYCGAKNLPLEIEHIVPKTRGGSNRVSNLSLACHKCNQKKGTQTAAEFGYHVVQAKAKQPLKDAAAINTTRWALLDRLKGTGLSIEIGTGGRTKFNRGQQGYPKAHWIDAACVGESGHIIALNSDQFILSIKATGHGSRQMCRTDKYGFPMCHRLCQKRHFGFQTGNIVKAIVPTGRYVGTHVGRVTCRATGTFDIMTVTGKVTVSHKHLKTLHYSDGYTYLKGKGALPPHA